MLQPSFSTYANFVTPDNVLQCNYHTDIALPTAYLPADNISFLSVSLFSIFVIFNQLQGFDCHLN